MSEATSIRKQFLEALNEIAGGQATLEGMTQELRQALLNFGSETPDNLNCADRVEVGPVGLKIVPKVRDREVLFRDIAHALEDEIMPKALKEHFPEISEKDWDAFTRLTTLIYILLPPDVPRTDD